jgi:hypothetical protein
MVGQRWDMDITHPLEFLPGWQEELRKNVQQLGKLTSPWERLFRLSAGVLCEDARFCHWPAGWDNWMIYESRQRGWTTVMPQPM